MQNMLNDTRVMLQRSRRVADNADFLSVALLSGNQTQIDEAVDDLLAAYDSYTGQAKTYSSRFGFDEVAKVTDPIKRDQSAANALAGVLIDLEVAAVLGRAAQAIGEIEGQGSVTDLDEAVVSLTQTIKAIEGPADTMPGTTRFAFDEVIASQTPKVISSPNVSTAKATYARQVKTFYDTLLIETTSLLMEAFKGVSNLDADKIHQGLQTIAGPSETLSGGRLVTRVLEATKRAIGTLKSILGSEPFNEIEKRLTKILDEIQQGGNVLQLFLKYTYGYDEGQGKIAEWSKTSQADHGAIDKGTQALQELQQQMVQAFALGKRIITTLHSLKWPLEWILKRFGGTLPLDLLMSGAFLLVMNSALLRGMDYADTTHIIKWVDGVMIISKRTFESK